MLPDRVGETGQGATCAGGVGGVVDDPLGCGGLACLGDGGPGNQLSRQVVGGGDLYAVGNHVQQSARIGVMGCQGPGLGQQDLMEGVHGDGGGGEGQSEGGSRAHGARGGAAVAGEGVDGCGEDDGHEHGAVVVVRAPVGGVVGGEAPGQGGGGEQEQGGAQGQEAGGGQHHEAGQPLDGGPEERCRGSPGAVTGADLGGVGEGVVAVGRGDQDQDFQGAGGAAEQGQGDSGSAGPLPGDVAAQYGDGSAEVLLDQEQGQGPEGGGAPALLAGGGQGEGQQRYGEGHFVEVEVHHLGQSP